MIKLIFFTLIFSGNLFAERIGFVLIKNKYAKTKIEFHKTGSISFCKGPTNPYSKVKNFKNIFERMDKFILHAKSSCHREEVMFVKLKNHSKWGCLDAHLHEVINKLCHF